MDEYIQNYKPGDKDKRPWGSYVTTAVGFLVPDQHSLAFCDKIIAVKPGTPEKPTALSIQMHIGRREDWRILAGEATVRVGKTPKILEEHHLKAGDSIHIPAFTWHSVENRIGHPLVFKERQSGICLDENDNIRSPTREDRRKTNKLAFQAIFKEIARRQLTWPEGAIHSVTVQRGSPKPSSDLR